MVFFKSLALSIFAGAVAIAAPAIVKINYPPMTNAWKGVETGIKALLDGHAHKERMDQEHILERINSDNPQLSSSHSEQEAAPEQDASPEQEAAPEQDASSEQSDGQEADDGYDYYSGMGY